MGRTVDQERAKHAWDAVCRIRSRDGKKYGGHAKKLPMRIMASGLGQALVFLHAKDYAPELLRDVGDWVLGSLGKHKRGVAPESRPAPDALIKAVVDGDSDQLRRATNEALAYLQWLTRFAEAEGLGGEDDT